MQKKMIPARALVIAGAYIMMELMPLTTSGVGVVFATYPIIINPNCIIPCRINNPNFTGNISRDMMKDGKDDGETPGVGFNKARRKKKKVPKIRVIQ